MPYGARHGPPDGQAVVCAKRDIAAEEGDQIRAASSISVVATSPASQMKDRQGTQPKT